MRFALAPPLDDEYALFAKSVFRLIPLKLFVADEAELVGPVPEIRTAAAVEFVCPYQMITVRGLCLNLTRVVCKCDEREADGLDFRDVHAFPILVPSHSCTKLSQQ